MSKRLEGRYVTSIANSFYDSVIYLKNRTRISHKVNSLSAICSADGKEIDGIFWGNTTNDIVRNGCD